MVSRTGEKEHWIGAENVAQAYFGWRTMLQTPSRLTVVFWVLFLWLFS